MNEIHKKALEVATRYKRAEADLLCVLQEVEVARVFVKLGFTSMFNYCVQALGLTESVAANQSGSLSVSKARKIAPVLTLENQDEWVEKAKILSTRKLEEEVARVAPREAAPERIKVVAEDRLELRMGISKALQEKLKRVQDLEAQRMGRAVSLEDTLETLLEVYLETKDPVKRAERVLKRKAANDASASVTGHVNRVKASENRERVPAT